MEGPRGGVRRQDWGRGTSGWDAATTKDSADAMGSHGAGTALQSFPLLKQGAMIYILVIDPSLAMGHCQDHDQDPRDLEQGDSPAESNPWKETALRTMRH